MIKRYLIKVTHNNGGGVYYVGKNNIIVGSYGHIDGILLNKKVTESRVIDLGYKRAGNAANNYLFSCGCVATHCTAVEVVEITISKDNKTNVYKTDLIDTINGKYKGV